MEKYKMLLTPIISIFILISCSEQSANNLDNVDSKNAVLERILAKADTSLAKSNMTLHSYLKVSDIKSQSDIKALVSKLSDPNIAHVPTYNSDFTEFKIQKIAEYKKDIPAENSFRKDKFNDLMVEYLKRNVAVGDEVFKLKYRVDDRPIETYAVVSSDSLIYDEILSNIVKFKKEKIPEEVTSVKKEKNANITSSSTITRQLSISIGETIYAYWIVAGYERGMASVRATIQYLATCHGGAINRSSCEIEINGHLITGRSYMEIGSHDAKYRKIGMTTNSVSGAYGMYLASPGASVKLQFQGGRYVVDINGIGSSAQATDAYSRYASSLPLPN